MKQETIKKIKKLTGTVISDKMDKTCVIEISEKKAHPKYGKIYISNRKIKAHDEKNEYKIGDVVEISETRPYSKSKAWQIIRKAVKTDRSAK